jgi:SNF2 family DNA or RNA helicase
MCSSVVQLKRPADFYQYQPKAIEFIKKRRYCALWVGMRLGKTIAVLTALQDLINSGDVRKTLVVAPLRVSINSWPEDLDAWAQLTLDFTLIRGTPQERLDLLKEPTNIHIINHEMVVWLVTAIGKDNWPYDCLVVDEARCYKNHKVATKKGNLTRFGALTLVRPQIKRVIELTGTPAPLSYIDLWAQMYLLDGGKRLGKNITAFRDKYCDPGREYHIWTIKDNVDEEIREKIKDLLFVVRTADQIDLPREVTNDIPVTLPPKVMTAYKTLQREFIVEIQKTKIVTFSAGSKSIKLLQMAAGRVYTPDGRIVVHREKEKALEELLELIDGPKLIIYSFVFEKDWILAKYPDARLLDDNPKTVQDWRAGKIDKLVFHPSSGKYGLTLYEGGNDIIWISPTWDLEAWEQTNVRLSHPTKADETIRIHRIVAQHTLELKVCKSLNEKREVQDFLLEDMIGKTASTPH